MSAPGSDGNTLNAQSKPIGFTGLSALVSDVEMEVSTRKALRSRGKQRSVKEKSTPSPHGTKQSRVAAGEPARAPKKSGVSWVAIIGVMVVIILVAIVVQVEGYKFRTKTDVSATPESVTPRFDPASTTPKAKPELSFERPPIGTDRVLSLAQIRWCLRGKIRLDYLRNLTSTDEQISRFNLDIIDYNGRCSTFQYRPGTLERARREVEEQEDRIFVELSLTWLEGDAASDSRQQARKLQEKLKNMGYDPGPVDGKLGEKTRLAMEAFRQDMERRSSQQAK